MGIPEFQPVDDDLADGDGSSGPGASLAEDDLIVSPEDWRLNQPDPLRPCSVVHVKENPPP